MSKKKKEHKKRLQKRFEEQRIKNKKLESKMQEIFNKLLSENQVKKEDGQETNG
jgi:hypothetical protein